MCGVCKTTAATRVARRHDLWLYPIDSRMLAYAEALESASLELTVAELWLERSPEQMADDFEMDARRRFPLVLGELRALPDDGAPVLVEGSLLVPELLGEAGLFVVADPALSGEMLRRRGSLTFARTRSVPG
jgi:hypothetical protein